MEPITDGNMIHLEHPITMAQLADVKARIKLGHPPGTRVELVRDGDTVNVEILVPDAEPWRARFGVHEPQAAL